MIPSDDAGSSILIMIIFEIATACFADPAMTFSIDPSTLLRLAQDDKGKQAVLRMIGGSSMR